MSSTTTSSSQQQRSLQRERERYQRERQQVHNSNSIGGQLLTSSGQPVSNTLFPEPIKRAQEDETTRRIKSTLGDFNQVQLYLNYDSKPLLGLTTRDLNRINGNKAKIEQIFSEMKQTFQPLGALEDGESEESHDREDDDNQLRRNGDDKGSEDGSSLSPMNMPSSLSKRKRKLSREDSSDDDGSDNNNGVQENRDGGGNEEENNDNDSDSDSSSGSSNSASSSSASSSSSSSSSEEDDDDDEVDGNKKTDNRKSDFNSKDSSTNKANFVKKECGSPQQEIQWNLMSFVDKKTLSTSVISTNSYVNKENVKVTNDSINDVIDKVARGELGEHASSRGHKSESSSPGSKKKRKSQMVESKCQPTAESRREHQLKQLNQQKKLQPPPPPAIQPPQDFNDTKQSSIEPSQRSRTKLLPYSDRVKKDSHNFPNNANNIEKDASPKAPDKLVVSISLLLLNRVPGQNNRVTNNFDSEHLTQSVKSEPFSPQHCSSLPHQPASFISKRQPSPPPASQQPQASSQENVSASSTSNSASVSAPPSHLLPFTPPLPSSLSNRTTPDNLVADDYLSAAKKLKHDADRETDRTVQARKYLQAVLYFILTGNAMEQRSCNDLEKVCVMYKETLNLIRFISGKFAKSRTSSPEDIPTTDHKLTALSYRCQSLLCLKLSRLKETEIRHNFRVIQSTIADHNLLSKIKDPRMTIPTHLFSAMHRQITMLQQLNSAHDLWQQADHLVEKHPSCAAFFSTVDNECGPLSLNSSFDDLVRYVTTGLKILE